MWFLALILKFVRGSSNLQITDWAFSTWALTPRWLRTLKFQKIWILFWSLFRINQILWLKRYLAISRKHSLTPIFQLQACLIVSFSHLMINKAWDVFYSVVHGTTLSSLVDRQWLFWHKTIVFHLVIWIFFNFNWGATFQFNLKKIIRIQCLT